MFEDTRQAGSGSWTTDGSRDAAGSIAKCSRIRVTLLVQSPPVMVRDSRTMGGG